MAANEYPQLYTCSHGEAEQRGETELWEKSFRENVACARAIEKAIRDCAGDGDDIKPGCAKSVLDEYGLKRTCFVLAHSVRELGPLVKAGEETEQWSRQFDYSRDRNFGRYYRADTALAYLEAFIGQVQDAYQALGLPGKEQCDSAAWDNSLVGRVLVLSPNVLRENYWSAENMLWLAEGGFGTAENARGRAVYAVNLHDGERTRWNREDFTGVLDERYLPDWAKEKLAALRAPEQKENSGPTMDGIS